jgi:hypothetical protein
MRLRASTLAAVAVLGVWQPAPRARRRRRPYLTAGEIGRLQWQYAGIPSADQCLACHTRAPLRLGYCPRCWGDEDDPPS